MKLLEVDREIHEVIRKVHGAMADPGPISPERTRRILKEDQKECQVE